MASPYSERSKVTNSTPSGSPTPMPAKREEMKIPPANAGKGTSTPKPAKTEEKKSSEGSSMFFDGIDEIEEPMSRILIRQLLKKGSYVSVTYPYKFAILLSKFGYIPTSLAEYLYLNDTKLLRVPSIKEYLNFMKSNEGDWMWLRGEIALCVTKVLFVGVEMTVREYLMKGSKPDKSLREEYWECLSVVSRSVLVATVVSQPFNMLCYRQIGQYVGKEEIYSSAQGIVDVFSKPGLYSFFEVTLARYIQLLVITVSVKTASLFWNHWLAGRISFLPNSQRFAKATDKNTKFHWIRQPLESMIALGVQYAVSIVLDPLEVAIITSSVWGSGITVGSEPFVPSGHFIQRWLTMWNDGRLFRRTSFFRPRMTSDITSFVVI